MSDWPITLQNITKHISYVYSYFRAWFRVLHENKSKLSIDIQTHKIESPVVLYLNVDVIF